MADYWRLEAQRMSSFRYKSGSEIQSLEFDYDQESGLLKFAGRQLPAGPGFVELDGRRVKFWTRKTAELVEVWLNGQIYRFETDDPRRRSGSADSGGPAGGQVKAQMPGKILQVHVKVGDRVEVDQNLLLMESMKMELALDASVAGTVSKVEVQANDMVSQGQLLVEITEDEV